MMIKNQLSIIQSWEVLRCLDWGGGEISCFLYVQVYVRTYCIYNGGGEVVYALCLYVQKILNRVILRLKRHVFTVSGHIYLCLCVFRNAPVLKKILGEFVLLPLVFFQNVKLGILFFDD